MEQQNKNKEFLIDYFKAMATDTPKDRDFLEKYMTDEALIAHIGYFETVFPGYEVFADEMTAEGNRVIVQARLKGIHKGELSGIPPTFKQVEVPFVIKYEIENNMIISHWMLVDQMALMVQLGVMPASEVEH